MRETGVKWCKISIFKYILLAVGFYFLQKTNIEDVLTMLGNIEPLKDVIQENSKKIITFYNDYLKDYYLYYFGFAIFLNIIAIIYLKKVNSFFVGFVLTILKVLTCSFISSLAVLYSSFTSVNKDSVYEKDDFTQTNIDDTKSNVNEKELKKQGYKIRNYQSVKMTPGVIFSSIVPIVVGVLGVYFILSLERDTGPVILIPILFVLAGIYTPFSKAAKQRYFAANVKRIEIGMHLKEVKGIMSSYEPVNIKKGNLQTVMTYRIKNHGDYEEIQLLFENDFLIDKAQSYRRTYYE